MIGRMVVCIIALVLSSVYLLGSRNKIYQIDHADPAHKRWITWCIDTIQLAR